MYEKQVIINNYPQAADGWFQLRNKEGRFYYYNHDKRITQWEHPVTGERVMYS
jgi:hypothetical protein